MRELVMLFIISAIIGCGGGDDMCSSVVVAGDNSQASCGGSASNEQQNFNSEADGISGELAIFCEDLCLERGNPVNGIREGDCFKECVEEHRDNLFEQEGLHNV